MGHSPWRPLLLLALACFLLGVMQAARNEILRRELQYCAHVSTAAAAWPLRQPHRRASALSVAEFTSKLSDEERLGWERTPRFTESGYLLTSLPRALREQLVAAHVAAKPKPEAASDHLTGRVLISTLPTPLESQLVTFLEAALCEWTQLPRLEFVNSYGPRTYTRGASLAAHGDRIRTHAVSAIVYVGAASPDRPWPLQFVENSPAGQEAGAVVREVYLSEDADVLLYESTQPHGRVKPLQGDSFTVVFLHWKPPGWTERVEELLRN